MALAQLRVLIAPGLVDDAPASHAGPLENLLRGETVPTLIIWGSQDRVLHVSGAALLEAAMPNARVVVMKGVGHIPMIEKPKETAARILTFLGR